MIKHCAKIGGLCRVIECEHAHTDPHTDISGNHLTLFTSATCTSPPVFRKRLKTCLTDVATPNVLRLRSARALTLVISDTLTLEGPSASIDAIEVFDQCHSPSLHWKIQKKYDFSSFGPSYKKLQISHLQAISWCLYENCIP